MCRGYNDLHSQLREAGETTQAAMPRHASKIGEIDLDSDQATRELPDQIGRIFRPIDAPREYQFA